jgi:hypothetical protein
VDDRVGDRARLGDSARCRGRSPLGNDSLDCERATAKGRGDDAHVGERLDLLQYRLNGGSVGHEPPVGVKDDLVGVAGPGRIPFAAATRRRRVGARQAERVGVGRTFCVRDPVDEDEHARSRRSVRTSGDERKNGRGISRAPPGGVGDRLRYRENVKRTKPRGPTMTPPEMATARTFRGHRLPPDHPRTARD